MAKTIQDLLRFAQKQARIDQIDYFDPRCPRPDEIKAWRHDCYLRSAARRDLFRQWPGRVRSQEPLIPGRYYGTRLVISPDDIDYTVGQYAPREIWQAVADYLRQTNDL
jgi:hypothetical protein